MPSARSLNHHGGPGSGTGLASVGGIQVSVCLLHCVVVSIATGHHCHLSSNGSSWLLHLLGPRHCCLWRTTSVSMSWPIVASAISRAVSKPMDYIVVGLDLSSVNGRSDAICTIWPCIVGGLQGSACFINSPISSYAAVRHGRCSCQGTTSTSMTCLGCLRSTMTSMHWAVPS